MPKESEPRFSLQETETRSRDYGFRTNARLFFPLSSNGAMPERPSLLPLPPPPKISGSECRGPNDSDFWCEYHDIIAPHHYRNIITVALGAVTTY